MDTTYDIKYGLKFSSPEVESAYLADCSNNLSFQATFSVSLALVLYTLFFSLDTLIVPDYLNKIWTSRAIVVICLGLIILLIRTEYFIKYSQAILSLTAVIVSGGLLYMFAIIPPAAESHYYVALLLVIPWTYLALGLRIKNALIFNVILLLIYNYGMIFLKNYPVDIIINNNYFLLGSSYMAFFGGYIIERDKRIKYLQALDLISLKEKADAANRATTQFYNNMSHELRTPMNIILGYTELLAYDLPDGISDGQRAGILAIQTSANHLLNLINDILDLSKIESGKLELHTQKFLLDDFVVQLKSASLPLAFKNNNNLVFNRPEYKITLNTDNTKLMQILLNLISNACKFTKNGDITIDINDETNHIIFKISDTGIGMTESQLKNIFYEFRQADASISGTYGGTGLGLTISKKLAVMMGGDIFVSSSANQGSEFTIKVLKNIN